MKKTFAFVAALAMTLALTASAKSTNVIFFNRPQFQPAEYTCDMDYAMRQLTVPFVYKGSIAMTEYFQKDNGDETWNTCDAAEFDVETCTGKLLPKAERTHDCFIIDSRKSTIPLYMTICQPCIDCFPCEALTASAEDAPYVVENEEGEAAPFEAISCLAVPGTITRWNLYYQFEGAFRKIDLMAAGAVFFTGKRGTAPAYIAVNTVLANESPLILFLQGKKSNYTFKYTENFLTDDSTWDQPDEGKYKTATAYIKSLSSVSGSTAILDQGNNVVKTLSFKLSRDASLTKQAITTTFTATMAEKGKGWEDCNIAEDASICETYFTNGEVDLVNEDGDYLDKFDAYLVKTNKKPVVASTIDNFLEKDSSEE